MGSPDGAVNQLHGSNSVSFSCLGSMDRWAYRGTLIILSSTAIGSRKYRIPSDLRSQAGYRLVSTMVGDHMGILGVVVFCACRSLYHARVHLKEHVLKCRKAPLEVDFWSTFDLGTAGESWD